jgi:hypothetical protein
MRVNYDPRAAAKLAGRAQRDFVSASIRAELRAQRDRATMRQWIAANVVIWFLVAMVLQFI